MTTTKIATRLTLLSSALLMSTMMWAQQPAPKPKASPDTVSTGQINGANITINYSTPSVKGRPVWGSEMVPYGQVWRAGANTSTTFTTDKDLMVEGQKLPAGKYSLYILVEENAWTYIFNSQTGQWGITRDHKTTEDPAKDVIRVKVKTGRTDNFYERLAYVIDAKGFSLRWENLQGWVSVK